MIVLVIPMVLTASLTSSMVRVGYVVIALICTS
jgi:hypothetical protein